MNRILAPLVLSALYWTTASAGADQLADRYRDWLRKDVVYIIAEAERQEFLSLESDADRDRFIERFWEMRDPDTSTEENEFRKEHYWRIEEANRRFAEGVPGWRTDRGRVFIRHGPPDSIRFEMGGNSVNVTVYRPTEALNILADSSKTALIKIPFNLPETEVWLYRHIEAARSTPGMFEVIFSRIDPQALQQTARELSALGPDTTLTYAGRLRRDIALLRYQASTTLLNRFQIAFAGAYRFGSMEEVYQTVFTGSRGTTAFDLSDMAHAMRDLEESTGEALYRKLALKKRLREEVSSEVYFEHFPMQVQAGTVLSDNGGTMVPVMVGLDGEYRGETLELLVDLATSQGKIVASVVDSFPLKGGDADAPRDFVYNTRLAARPGQYTLRVYGILRQRRATAVVARDVTLPDYSNPEFAVSDVLLFSDVISKHQDGRKQRLPVFVGGSEPIRMQDFLLVPSVERRFRRVDNLTAFVEVYNPGLAGDNPDLEVNCRFWRDEQLVASMPRKSLQYVTEAGGNSERARTTYGVTIPLRTFSPGNYRLEMAVVDPIAGQTATREARFEIR